MVKKVKITINSTQRLTLSLPEDDPLPEDGAITTSVESEGELVYEDGVFSISYPETEVTGLDGCITSLSFSDRTPGRVSIFRAGPVRTALMFGEGQRYISVYDTGFGSFEVSIVTLCCENGIDENGGTLRVSYLVEIKGSEAERTELTVNVRCIE